MASVFGNEEAVTLTVRLLGRGTTVVRRVNGPRGAPNVVLLHGWIASGGLNWFQAFGPLGRHFNVLAPDLRGHGRGIRCTGPFQLEDCADDLAALLDRLEIGSVIAVGYSMGGAVAQLLWRRHPALVAGLVLCATSPMPAPQWYSRIVLNSFMSAVSGPSLAAGGTLGILRALARSFGETESPRRPTGGVFDEFWSHDWPSVINAGRAISRFDARSWIHDVDVPTAVLVTSADSAIPPEAQLRQARDVRGATVHRIDGGHFAWIHPAWGSAVTRACLDVAAKISRPLPPARQRSKSAHSEVRALGQTKTLPQTESRDGPRIGDEARARL